jgi:hypothetical protein
MACLGGMGTGSYVLCIQHDGRASYAWSLNSPAV